MKEMYRGTARLVYSLFRNDWVYGLSTIFFNP